MDTGQDRIGVLLIAGDAREAAHLHGVVRTPDEPDSAFTEVRSLREGLEVLRRARHDVAVVDLPRPTADELAGLRRLREVAPELAIVVRGGSNDERAKVDALSAGAQDYVAAELPESGELLRRSILFALARVRGERASRRLAAIVAASGEAIVGLTFEGEVTSWNHAAERIYGYAGGDAIGRSLSMLCISPEGRRQIEDALARTKEGRPVPTIDTIQRRADGQTIDVALTVSCVRGAAGVPVAAAAVAREVTAAKRIERERERAVSELRDAQRIGRMGSWRFAPDEGDSFSEEFHRLLGLDPADGRLTFARWLSHLDPAEHDKLRAALAGAAEGRDFEFDCRIRTSDGAQRSLHLIGRPDPADPRYVAGTAQDVTELRALERALRASRAELVTQRELLGRVFDSAPVGMAMMRPDGHFLRVNQALCEIVGHTERELLELGLLDITDASDAATVSRGLGALATGRSESRLTEARLARGEASVWTQLSMSLICDEEGTPLHLVVQVSDISAHKDVEAALRLERDHTAAILGAMSEGYALTEDGRIVAVNDALCQLTGFAREELLGSAPPWPFSSASSSPEELEKVCARVVDERGGTVVVQFQRKDGSQFDAEVTARPAHRPDGSALGWVSTIRDVSERRRYEAELEHLATEDPLTGLANHRVFHERLADQFAAAIRHNRPLSVAVLDLDHFKEINDRHGHLVGDHVLETVAERLRTVVRQGELLARVGGEEFAWILPEADIDGAHVAAERARRAISGTPFEQVGSLTISIGVGSRGLLHDATALYERADRALYAAKHQGRNRTICWDRLAGGVVASRAADG